MEAGLASTYAHLLVGVEDGIAYVTMNRPEVRNALSVALMGELEDCLSRVGERRDVSVVVLRGRGPSFCSGHDLKELANRGLGEYRVVFDTCARMMRKLQSIPQPVIAQVHGAATAAGCQLVATCDLAVASEDAVFALPGVKIGLWCSTPMVSVSRNLPRKKVLEMLLTGEPIAAEEALRYGLVNKVVPRDRLDEETRVLADRIKRGSVNVIGMGKRAFYRQLEMPEELAYEFSLQVACVNAAMSDAEEGICAFLEKRAPRWPGS